jgi:hypothetical protein
MLMQSPDGAPERQHPAFDWIDVLLGFFTICAGFGVASHFGWSGRPVKYGLAVALAVVIGARRALIGPPRAVAMRRGASVLGFLGAASMLFGLVIASFGVYMLSNEHETPIPEPARIDRDAIERQLSLPGLGRRCTKDGKTLTGRACMTPEERAAEAAADEKERAAEMARLEGEKKDRMSRFWTIAGVGTLLVLAGIGLDILRSRRDAVPPA